MSETLPLADLLDTLRKRGLPLGLYEYLSVGCLLQVARHTLG